jgi:propanol-preferring alcohol dehydrogenase
MKAFRIAALGPVREGSEILARAELPVPTPAAGEILIRVSVCGICHTELDEIEGRTPPPRLPVTPGHQVIGRVERAGDGAVLFAPGDRVGVAWIFSACGRCGQCRNGRENLCPQFRATGRDVDGGYAEYMVVPEQFAHRIPSGMSDSAAAPLLCAGAIGYRSIRLAGVTGGGVLGLTGFGASAHLVLKMVRHRFPDLRVQVTTRSAPERRFALELGAVWAGEIGENPPAPADWIIDTTPAWKPVVESLRMLRPGGRLVVNAIRKEDADRDVLARLDYATHLWYEKEIKSVANVTRSDVSEFLSLAAESGLEAEVRQYPLDDAPRALLDLRRGNIRGATVLVISP